MINGILKQHSICFSVCFVFQILSFTIYITQSVPRASTSTARGSFTLRTKPHKWGGTQNVSSTRKHMETSRLNIVFQGIKVEDGARICTPNFEVFYQKEEIKKSRMNFKKHQSQAQVWKKKHVISKPVMNKPDALQRRTKGQSRPQGFSKKTL